MVDLAGQLDRSLTEQNKYQSLLRELLEAQRNRKSEQLSKDQLALFEAAWKARSTEDESAAGEDDDGVCWCCDMMCPPSFDSLVQHRTSRSREDGLGAGRRWPATRSKEVGNRRPDAQAVPQVLLKDLACRRSWRWRRHPEADGFAKDAE